MDNLPANLTGSTAPASMGTLAKVAQAIVAAVKGRDLKIEALEARIAELEREPFRYDGPHETGKAYSRRTFVTHAGSLWHANQTTASRPGDGPAWTLAAKRGRDGRDLR
jgi:hypothetical protein